jgi:hypothetical protein
VAYQVMARVLQASWKGMVRRTPHKVFRDAEERASKLVAWRQSQDSYTMDVPGRDISKKPEAP